MRELTEKELAFVVNRAAGMTNRDAAIAAGFPPDDGDRLMRDPAIRNTLKAYEI